MGGEFEFAAINVDAVLSERVVGYDGVRRVHDVLFEAAERLFRPHSVSLGLTCRRGSSPHRLWAAHVFGIADTDDPEALVDTVLATVRPFVGIVGTIRWDYQTSTDRMLGSELPLPPLVDLDEPALLLNLNERLAVGFARCGIVTVRDALAWTTSQILEITNVAEKSLAELEDRLFDHGYRFGRYVDPTAPP